MTSEAGRDAELLAPRAKVKSDDGVQTGAIDLPRAGTVVLRFDNVHSMFRSKTVRWSSFFRLACPRHIAVLNLDSNQSTHRR